MKNLIISSFLSIASSLAAKAQDSSKAELLKEPTDWTFERFSLPPQFATSIKYHGAEELRFSPGMFKKGTPDYFTYSFVAQLDNTTTISKNEISDYLTVYFKGLCRSTATARKLTIDTSAIHVSLEKKKGTNNETSYDAVLDAFCVFTDGAPIKLNLEIKVTTKETSKKTYLLFIVSPQEKTNAVWKRLYEIQKSFVAP